MEYVGYTDDNNDYNSYYYVDNKGGDNNSAKYQIVFDPDFDNDNNNKGNNSVNNSRREQQQKASALNERNSIDSKYDDTDINKNYHNGGEINHWDNTDKIDAINSITTTMWGKTFRKTHLQPAKRYW